MSSRLRREGTPLRGERTRLRREESGRGCAARDEVATAPRGMRSRLRRERSVTRFEVRRRCGCFTGAPGVFGFFLCFPLRCWPARNDTYVRAAQPRSSSTPTCSRDAQRRPRPQHVPATRSVARPQPVPATRSVALVPRRAASPSSRAAQPRSSSTSICDAQRRRLTPASPAPSRCSTI